MRPFIGLAGFDLGITLGNPNGAAALGRAGKGNKAAIAQVKADADQHAQDLAIVIKDIRKQHVAMTLEAIANQLNSREIMTPRGRRWYPSSVANLLRRIG